jgi:multisubunit Na+/H+ antiporter MnhF subunit
MSFHRLATGGISRLLLILCPALFDRLYAFDSMQAAAVIFICC